MAEPLQLDINPTWAKVFATLMFFFISILYIVTILVALGIESLSTKNGFEFYFLGLFTFAYILLIRDFKKYLGSFLSFRTFLVATLKQNRLFFLMLLLMFVTTILIRVNYSSYVPISGDEGTPNVIQKEFSAFAWAAREQQPPLSYILGQLNSKLFGPTPETLRPYVFILGSILTVALMIFLRLFTGNFILIVGGSLLVFATPNLFHMGMQARSGYVLAQLMGTFLIGTLALVLNKTKEPQLGAGTVFTVALVFLMTLGLQPPIFLATLMVVLALARILFRFQFQKIIPVLLALLVYLPIQANIVRDSQGYVQLISLDTLHQFLQTMLFKPISGIPFWVFACCLFVVLVFTALNNSISEKLRSHLKFLILALFFILVYHLATVFALMTFIKWQMKPRYFLLNSFMMTLTLILSVSLAVDFVKSLRFKKELSFFLPALIFGASFYFLFYGKYAQFIELRTGSTRLSYQVIAETFSDDDVLFPICVYSTDGCWEHDGITRLIFAKKLKMPLGIKFPIAHAVYRIRAHSKIEYVYVMLASDIRNYKIDDYKQFLIHSEPGSFVYKFPTINKFNDLRGLIEFIYDEMDPQTPTGQSLRNTLNVYRNLARSINQSHEELNSFKVDTSRGPWEARQFEFGLVTPLENLARDWK